VRLRCVKKKAVTRIEEESVSRDKVLDSTGEAVNELLPRVVYGLPATPAPAHGYNKGL
jgi:hypothetical protein